MASLLQPNRGWFLGAAGMLAAWVLDRIDAPLWIAILTLVILLASAGLWPWIEQNALRRKCYGGALGLYALGVVGFGFLGGWGRSSLPAAGALKPALVSIGGTKIIRDDSQRKTQVELTFRNFGDIETVGHLYVNLVVNGVDTRPDYTPPRQFTFVPTDYPYPINH